MKAIPFALVFLLPLSAACGLLMGGPWVFSTVVLTFVFTPLLDRLLKQETQNPSQDSKNPLFDLWLYLWVPVQLGLIAWGAWDFANSPRPPLERIGLILSIGVAGAAGINIAHELMHRPGRLQRALAEVLMTSVSYTHFCVEHVLGHHKNVATPLDPATARLGESLYRFLPRSLLGGLRSAWRLESERVARQGIKAMSLQDRRMRYALVLGLIYAVLLGLSPAAALFFAAQGVVAFMLLEAINYVEHYGLQRKAQDGRYERVQPRHSWSSAHRMSAWYLFNLPRHADHHFLASRPYPILRHFPDSPQLPAGYATMVLVAACPPLWRRVMDQRAEAWA